MKRVERYAWAVVLVALVAFAIPWFLWRNETVVAGLPLWLWWHVGWLVLCSVTFAVFANRAWGVWVET